MRLRRKIFIKFLNFVNFFSKRLATSIFHLRKAKKWPNLKCPRDFNEKLQWLKLNEDDNLKALCADKYEVHKYIESKGIPEILNRIYAVYEHTSEIDWESLPEKFVIKCTHGSGFNIVTTKKSVLVKKDVVTKLNTWLKETFGNRMLEYHYNLIKPRIIVEEYLENNAGLLPVDYKIYCFHGKAKLVLVCTEREKNLKLDFFDLDWNRLEIGLEERKNKLTLEKPQCFDLMVKYAEILALDFSFVRVDFYDKDGFPVFGEMTFTPAGNAATYYNEDGLEYLGNLLDLSKANIKVR